jgi:hypothetical protein
MIDQKHTGIVNTTQMKQRLLDLSKNDFKAEMQADVTKIFGLSRAAEAYKNKDDITLITHSEIMDNNTCPECLGVDGMEFSSIDDPDFAPFATGQYDQCEGGNNCRGFNIFQAE